MQGQKVGEVGDKDPRWRRVLLNALGQKKMFKRPIPAMLHFFVYAGFIIINIEIMEIILDGMLGQHRLFAPFMANVYGPFITIFEFLALAVLISCVIFLIRRNIVKVKRFTGYELTSWPRMDANIILLTEIFLMSAFLVMNGADLALQERGAEHYFGTGNFFFSGFIKNMMNGLSTETLLFLERFGWWAHIIGIFAFLNYIPFSKHLHIFLAFPNSFYSKISPQGEMKNMPEIEQEVKMMLDPSAATGGEVPPPPERFGAKDITDLPWPDVLAAFSCTECGRCTDQCPANQTGKLLSPRKIMMDTRDRADELGEYRRKNGADSHDEKALIHDRITSEELLACTTCQACVEACPVNINPLSIIEQLRRYLIMDEAKSPSQWNTMFGNVENNMAPWPFSPMDRDKWAREMADEE